MNILIKVWHRTFIWRWVCGYRAYIEKITTSGYIPQPSPVMRALVGAIFRVWAFLQVGRIRVVGYEKIDPNGRFILVGNHSSFLDAIVLYPLMPANSRSMGAYDVMRTFWGIPGIVLTKLGCFPVDRSNGRTVLGPCTDAVVAGHSLGMFPEGKISPGGALLPFKKGAAWIANGAYDRLGGKERVGIIPVHICYGKRHAASAYNYLKMGFKWRGGVTITVLDPIWINDLDNRDAQYIMSLVRREICSVSCATTSCSS